MFRLKLPFFPKPKGDDYSYYDKVYEVNTYDFVVYGYVEMKSVLIIGQVFSEETTTWLV